jgi:hypothetical protein
MTIDIRAKIYCSLGPIISGSFADDYLQDNGLIKTRGEVVLDGIYRPEPGTIVEFAYVQGNIGSRLPRKLRVLSVFADPYRNTTSISIGCKLTYLDNRKPPLKNPTSVDENGVTPPGVIDVASLPISASYIFDQCLTALGLVATSNPLTNKFSVAEFSLDGGYLSVMSDLLKSEGYFGYLNESEELVIQDFNTETGVGPVIRPESLIDLSPINTGELPGESVAVNYSYLKLEKPTSTSEEDPTDGTLRNYTYSEVTGSPITVTVTGTKEGSQQSQTYSASYTPVSKTTEQYKNIVVYDADKQEFVTKSVMGKRTEESVAHGLEVAGSYVTALIQVGDQVPIYSTFTRQTETSYIYDAEGTVISTVTEELEPGFVTQLAAPIAWADVRKAGGSSTPGGLALRVVSRSVVETDYDKFQDITRTVTMNYKAKVYSTAGQNEFARQMDAALAEPAPVWRKNKLILAPVSILAEAGNIVFENSTVSINQGRGSLNDTGGARAGNDPLEQENTSGLEWIAGSTQSQLVTEFSVPYVSDDYIGEGGIEIIAGYSIVRSDADVKAKNYGNIQNRLLLGNRNGVSIQLPVEKMPGKPFSPIYIDAAGFIGQFRTNGTNYTFDAEGIVTSTDALFWGGVGQS